MAPTKKPVSDFRKVLRRALFLNHAEDKLFNKIPEAVIDGLFRHNFNGNLAMAERVLFNRYSDVERVDRARLEQEKQNIKNLAKAGRQITKSLITGEKLLFVTDNDNDGSLAQACLIEFLKAMPAGVHDQIHIEYAQPIGGSRGLTVEIVDKAVEARGWASDEVFTIITADNGINNRSEQEKIQERYTRSSLIITDHHLPDDEKVVQENDRSLIVNPKYYPTEYFKKKNISGANTAGLLLNAVINEYSAKVNNGVTKLEGFQKQAMANIDELGAWANLLDYANADMADMPTRPYIIDKALNLRPLLNVSTSMSNLITGSFSDEDIERVAQVSNGLDSEWIREKLADVATLNIFAHKLLNLYNRYKGLAHTFGEKEFYALLSDELTKTADTYESINPNYIEQLRPIIFNLSAIDNKDMFMALTAETMIGVFEDLRRQERDLLKGMREVGLLRQEIKPHSTILYPVDGSITKLFNRRLLGKAYNQANNGFLLILSNFDGREASGSMRSLYPMSDILEGKDTIEKELGVTLDFQGHEMAAGFFVRSTNDEMVTEEKLSRLNDWIDGRVEELKMADFVNQMPNLEVDFAAVGLAEKINAAVKANLAGMWSLPSLIRFSPNKGEEVWVTDPETTEQINLAEVVRRKSYGYQAIATDFDGGAFVVPIELLRAVVDSGYKKGLRLSYMNEGVYMANQVVDMDAMPNLVPFKAGRRDQENLVDYYEKTFKDSNFLPLTREDFRNSPYFKYNKYGEVEFEQWENLIINMLDRTNRDIMAVVDTEGTGLGKAPKCFNIGGTNIAIDPTSGKTMDAGQFEAHYFRSESGKEFVLAPDQLAALVPMEEGDEVSSGEAVILYKTSLERGTGYYDRYAMPGTLADLEPVTNVKEEENGTVVYNRRINGFAFSFLINNNDFAITKEFEDLTGIGNWMVEKFGKSAVQVDRVLSHYYETLRNADGEPVKVIFQAHNMPYDKGVVSANFQRLNTLMDNHITSDTAKLARQAKLAYDDTPVSSFEEVAGIPAKAYFYDSPYSDYSLSTFLFRCGQGKSGVFPDTKAKVLLRYNAGDEKFSIIDREANREVEIAASLDELNEKKTVGELPNNAVKYSVERLSSRAMIRNIMLLDKPKSTKVALLPHELPHKAALEMFQDNYHFDSTMETNISHFRQSLWRNEKALDLLGDVNMQDLAERFLSANKATQAKFHDGWIYEKVLAHHEPDAKTKRVPAEIVELVNYYTDLPDKKIRKIFEDVINFKRHFGIEHALVHEQHNNIRQRSDDGQGLSDTAYEAVLPQFLAMMKFYNPYYKSVGPAADKLINSNIKGSLIQHMIGDDYNNEMARDSYSVSQMLAFHRQGKTDVVKEAQKLAKEGDLVDGVQQPIKFKLSADILPPGSAVYATPKRHLSQTEIHEVAEQLEFILVNEQLKTSAKMARNLSGSHCARMVEIAEANDEKIIAMRDGLMEKFDSILFSRRDADVKKVADMMKKAFEGEEVKIPRGFEVTDDMLQVAEGMAGGFETVFQKLTMDLPIEYTDGLLKKLRVMHQVRQEREEELKYEAADEEPLPVDDSVAQVRTPEFLPDLDIERREPLKFVMSKFGVKLCFPLLKKKAEEAANGIVDAPEGDEEEDSYQPPKMSV